MFRCSGIQKRLGILSGMQKVLGHFLVQDTRDVNLPKQKLLLLCLWLAVVGSCYHDVETSDFSARP